MQFWFVVLAFNCVSSQHKKYSVALLGACEKMEKETFDVCFSSALLYFDISFPSGAHSLHIKMQHFNAIKRESVLG